MKIPMKPVALGAAALPRRIPCPNNVTAGSQVLMATTGQIHIADFDGSSFTTTMNATVTGAPTWVEFLEPNKLYAVNENGEDLRLFNLDLSGPELSEPVATATGSSGVVHLEFNQDKTRLVGSGYGAGTVDIWNIENDQFTLIKTIESTGELGPVKPNQEKPHPHQAVNDPSGRYFVVNDLGTDEILVIDSVDDAWEPRTPTKTAAGCGPRHGVFYPSGADVTEATHYMIICELSNDAVVYSVSYEDAGLSLTETQTISSFFGTKPQGAAGGEIALSKDNTVLYVSNRLTGGDSDNITGFQVDQDGSLTVVDEIPTGGLLPRMFSLGTGHLFVGNQNGPDAAVAFELYEDGSLSKEPVASLPLADFGGAEFFGPAYIKQLN